MRALVSTLAAAALLTTPAAAQGLHYYICSTRDAAKKVGYVSAIFADRPGDLGAVETSWKSMLTTKYGSVPFPSQSCQEATSNAAAEAPRSKLYDFMRGWGSGMPLLSPGTPR